MSKSTRILRTLSATKTPWLHMCVTHTTYYGNYLTWFSRRAGEGEELVTLEYYHMLLEAELYRRYETSKPVLTGYCFDTNY